jgi:hypothetical protein
LYIAGRVLGGTLKQNTIVQPGHRNYRVHLSQGPGQLRQTEHGLTGSTTSVIDAAEDCNNPSEPEDFAAEKIALLSHLAKIERETGWKTSERARDLRVLWGLEN